MCWSAVARSVWVTVVGLVLAAGVLTACGRSGDGNEGLARPSEEFCEVAYEYDQDVTGIGSGDPEGHLEYLEPLARTAPDDVRDDAETVRDAMRRVAEGDDSMIDDPDVEAALDRLNRRAIDGCELLDQEPPGGL